jgi:hypothetical protein
MSKFPWFYPNFSFARGTPHWKLMLALSLSFPFLHKRQVRDAGINAACILMDLERPVIGPQLNNAKQAHASP